MKEVRIKDGSVEQQIKQIEKYLQHLSSRMQKVVHVETPPVPMFASAQKPEGIGFLFIIPFPLSGKITGVSILAEGDKVDGWLEWRFSGGKAEYSFKIEKGKAFISLEEEVVEGDSFIFFVDPSKVEEVELISASVLLQVGDAKMVKRQVLLSKVMNQGADDERI